MEFTWMDIRYKQPPDKPKGKEYLVTAYNALWQTKTQTMIMTWDVEIRRGFEQFIGN